MKIALDHLGWLGPDLSRLVAVFEGLGFRVVGPAPLQHGDTTEPAAQWSAHVMLADTYLELTSLCAGAAKHPLQPWRSEPPAVRLVVLRTGEAAAERERVAAAGWRVSELQHAARRLPYGKQGTARFHWFGLDENPVPGTEFPAPGVLVAWVEHLDRAAVFDPGEIGQPNTACAIAAVHHAGAAWPAALADERAGNVELVGCDAGPQAGGTVTGVDFLVDDLDACARTMRLGGTPFTAGAGVLEVPADFACGTRLRFRVRPAAGR